MALLVAQTRVESGVHSALEVLYGGAARRARHARRLPGVRDDRRRAARERGATRPRRGRTRRTRSYLVGAAVRDARRARVRGRQRRERRVSARRLRGADGARRPRSTAGYRPGDFEAIAITASPCGGCRQWLHELRSSGSSTAAATARSSTRDARRAAARTRWSLPSCEVGLRRRRRAAERRQVDARQRALRRQGRDRLRQAADDAAAHLRHRQRRRLPARARRPARLPAAARRAHRADAAHASTRRSRTSTPSCSCFDARERIGAGDRFIAERVFALGVPVVIALNKVDRLKPGHIAAQMATAAAARRLPRAASGQREDRRRHRRAARRARRAAARGAARTSRPSSDRPLRRGADRRARAREGAAA